MPKDKYQATRQKWKAEHTKAYTIRILKDKEADVIQFMEETRPLKPKLVEIIRKYLAENG